MFFFLSHIVQHWCRENRVINQGLWMLWSVSHYLTDIKVWGHWPYLIRLITFFFSWVTALQQSDILGTMTSEWWKWSLKAVMSCLAVFCFFFGWQTILVVIWDKNWVVCHPQIMPKYRYVCTVFQLYLASVAANSSLIFSWLFSWPSLERLGQRACRSESNYALLAVSVFSINIPSN